MKLTKEALDFINYAQEKWDLLDNGKVKFSNEYNDKLCQIVTNLKEIGRLQELIPLLSIDFADSVRLEAACHLLAINNSTAEATLNSLKSLKGTLAFTAEIMLEEWKKGNIKF